MKLHRIHSHNEYLHHAKEIGYEFLDRLAREAGIVNTASGPLTVEGFSYPARKMVSFVIENSIADPTSISWSETVVCPITNLCNRKRSLLHILDIEAAPYPDTIIYLTEQFESNVYDLLNKKYTNLIGSEYLEAEIQLGAKNNQGTRNEDLTQLTFADESIDCILSLDCFEHIPNYHQAFRECSRILKMNGKMLFTVPFNAHSHTTLTRAELLSDGSIKHLTSKEYHLHKLGKGCLSYYTFGWEILEDLKLAGFRNAYALLFWSEEFGYFGGENFLLAAFK